MKPYQTPEESARECLVNDLSTYRTTEICIEGDYDEGRPQDIQADVTYSKTPCMFGADADGNRGLGIKQYEIQSIKLKYDYGDFTADALEFVEEHFWLMFDEGKI